MRIALTIIGLLFSATLAAAEQMPVAKVEYSADTRMEAGGMVMNGKVYHARNKDRMEMNVGGSNTVMIVRTDKQIAWMLMPEQKTFMEMSLEESQKKSNDMTNCSVTMKSSGTDTVNGIKATKNSVSMTCPDNKGYKGALWVTNDGIMVKMDVTATDEGENVRIVNELSNLKLGKQPAKLFEVPAGYQPMNIGGLFGSIGAAMKSAQEDAERQRKADEEKELRREQERSNSSSGRDYTAAPSKSSTSAKKKAKGRDYTSSAAPSDSGVIDTINKVKGLFNW